MKLVEVYKGYYVDRDAVVAIQPLGSVTDKDGTLHDGGSQVYVHSQGGEFYILTIPITSFEVYEELNK